MSLLLTIVSILALWAFLTELVVGLLLIFKTLESIRGGLQRIVAGVRAIERETSPLDRLSGELAPAVEDAQRALGQLVQRAAVPLGGERHA